MVGVLGINLWMQLAQRDFLLEQLHRMGSLRRSDDAACVIFAQDIQDPMGMFLVHRDIW
jgi:hypothetical protein